MSNSSLPSIAQDSKTTALQFVQTHGKIRVTVLAGGALAALGTVAPFAHVNALFGEGSSYNVLQTGLYGVALLAVAIVLGIFPIVLKRYAKWTLVAYGAACGLFGMFVAIWLASFMLANTLGGLLGGLSIGFYLTLIGYGAMVFGYYRLQSPQSMLNA